LLSEEVDAAIGKRLGNFPQAFSHTGLINAAWAISEGRCERRARGGWISMARVEEESTSSRPCERGSRHELGAVLLEPQDP